MVGVSPNERKRMKVRSKNFPSSPAGSTVPTKRFYIGADIELLRAILQANPYANGSVTWSEVLLHLHESIGFTSSTRQAADRVHFLITKFRKGLLADINKMGTEVQWNTRAELCKSVSILMQRAKRLNAKSEETASPRTLPGMSTAENEESNANSDAAIASSSTSPTCQLPAQDATVEHNYIRRKSASDSTTSLIEKKAKLDAELRTRELELREEQVRAELDFKRKTLEYENERSIREDAREEKRLKLEEQRLSISQNNHEQLMEILRMQQTMMTEFLKTVASKCNK